jgi:hypothetical protein
MNAAATEAESAPRPLFNRGVDVLLVGGLSLVLLVPVLLLPPEVGERLLAVDMMWGAVLLNWPHFMASYWLVYSSREMVRRHPWAAVRFPALLALYAVVAVAVADISVVPIKLMLVVSSAYLAWHYTGQVWGMVASSGFLARRPTDDTERRLLRANLNLLLFFHVTLVAYRLPFEQSFSQPVLDALAAIHRVAAVLAGLSALLGLAGWWHYYRRVGRLPTPEMALPWLAAHAWYALLIAHPGTLGVVQLAHALQYLAFPLRVGVNRRLQQPGARPRDGVLAGVKVAFILVATGALALWAIPTGLAWLLQAAGYRLQAERVMAVCMAFVNIHHYFTDGCTWKVGQPEVRRQLFWHVGAR